jgi:hypothetical protein
MSRVFVQMASGGDKLVGPSLGRTADRFIQLLAQAATANRTLLLTTRSGSNQIACLFPDGTGPWTGFRASSRASWFVLRAPSTTARFGLQVRPRVHGSLHVQSAVAQPPVASVNLQ